MQITVSVQEVEVTRGFFNLTQSEKWQCLEKKLTVSTHQVKHIMSEF